MVYFSYVCQGSQESVMNEVFNSVCCNIHLSCMRLYMTSLYPYLLLDALQIKFMCKIPPRECMRNEVWCFIPITRARSAWQHGQFECNSWFLRCSLLMSHVDPRLACSSTAWDLHPFSEEQEVLLCEVQWMAGILMSHQCSVLYRITIFSATRHVYL